MKEMTEQEARLRLSAICSQAEHCSHEMVEKMRRWGVADDISEDEYMAVLRPLLKSKRKSIRAANEYELNTKLARFGISRGFSFDQIRRCLGDDVTGMTGLDIEYTDGEYED